MLLLNTMSHTMQHTMSLFGKFLVIIIMLEKLEADGYHHHHGAIETFCTTLHKQNMCHNYFAMRLCQSCSHRQLTCYKCTDTDFTSNHCHHREACHSSEEVCAISSTLATGALTQKYVLGCINRTQCSIFQANDHMVPGADVLHGKGGCCYTNNCNNNITSVTRGPYCTDINTDACGQLLKDAPTICSNQTISKDLCCHTCSKSNGCKDIDEQACQRLSSTVPNMCDNHCIADLCKATCYNCQSTTAAPGHMQVPTKASTPVNHHGQVTTAPSTPANHHGQVTTAPSTPANHHGQASTAPSTPANHHGQVTSAPSTTGQMQVPTKASTSANHHGHLTTAPSTPVNHHGQVTTAPSTPANHHGQVTAAPSTPANHHGQVTTAPSSPANHHSQASTTPSTPANHHGQLSTAPSGQGNNSSSHKTCNHVQQRNCPLDFDPVCGHCYFFSNQPETWQDAQNICNALNGYLVELETDDEKAFLDEHLFKKYQYDRHYVFWLGGKRTQNQWTWQRATIPINWGQGGIPDSAPNTDCLEYGPMWDYKMNNADCLRVSHFICELK